MKNFRRFALTFLLVALALLPRAMGAQTGQIQFSFTDEPELFVNGQVQLAQRQAASLLLHQGFMPQMAIATQTKMKGKMLESGHSVICLLLARNPERTQQEIAIFLTSPTTQKQVYSFKLELATDLKKEAETTIDIVLKELQDPRGI